MWNMQLCMVHLSVLSDFWYLRDSASGGAKTSFSDQKWLNFQSHFLSCKDIKHWKPPKDAPCKATYFTYQAQNCIINVGGHNWENGLAKTGTDLATSGFHWNCYSRNRLQMEPMLTLSVGAKYTVICNWAVLPYIERRVSHATQDICPKFYSLWPRRCGRKKGWFV